MVSTIVDPAVQAGLNVDHKFDVQDNQGRIWFYTANSVGPLVFVVNAVFLKLFGTNFWSLHGGALLFYAFYLAAAMMILWRAGELLLQFYLALPLFLPPPLHFSGYEALGEVPGLFFVLLTFTTFMVAGQAAQEEDSPRATRWFLCVGLWPVWRSTLNY